MATPLSTRTRVSLLVICAASFFMAADVTIVNIAVPAIAREYDAPMAALQWVVDSYNIVLAGLLLLGAGLGERFSRRWVFIAGVLAFAVGSLIAGIAPSVPALVLGRVVMGIGAALLLAPAMALIAMIFPAEKRARALATWTIAATLGMATSPIVGGVLLTFVSWHWLFLMNVPAMIVVAVIGMRVLPSGGSSERVHLDVTGAILSVIGFALFLGGLIEAPRIGWTSPAILAALAIGALALAAFVWWELRSPRPMIELRALRRRGVLGAVIALMLSYVSFTGTMFIVTQQLEVVVGVPVIGIGAILVPTALAVWLVSVRASRLTERIGPGRAVIVGVVVMTVGFTASWAGALLDSVACVVVALAIAGSGWGLVMPVCSVVIINDLPERLLGSASGLSMQARYVGASFGIAILGSVIALQTGARGAHGDVGVLATGIAWAYAAGALITALGVVLVSRLLWNWHPQST